MDSPCWRIFWTTRSIRPAVQARIIRRTADGGRRTALVPDRVLLTTDDLEQAVRSNAALEAAGFTTDMASTQDDVRQLVARREPDCIVLTGGLHEQRAGALLAAARERMISTLGLVEE